VTVRSLDRLPLLSTGEIRFAPGLEACRSKSGPPWLCWGGFSARRDFSGGPPPVTRSSALLPEKLTGKVEAASAETVT
jgi:hypothetical protein